MSNLSFSSQNSLGHTKKTQILNAPEKKSAVVQRVNVNFYITTKGNRPALLGSSAQEKTRTCARESRELQK